MVSSCTQALLCWDSGLHALHCSLPKLAALLLKLLHHKSQLPPLPTPAHRCVFSTRISAYTACGCAWLAGSGSAAWQTCRGWQSGSNQGCGTVDICMQANAGQATAWIQAMCCSECAVRHAAARSAATLQLRNHSSPGSACCPAQSPGRGPASARTSERRPACGARAGEAVA